MATYGLKAETAFRSLGMRPVEILGEKEESVRLYQIVDELREDEQVETVVRPFVKKYFEVLENEGMVEYDESGFLYDPTNRSMHKNGHDEEEIREFVESF